MNNKKILILLSTYNGTKFLRAQMDSLLAQKNVDFKILIRDDGSTDETVVILKEYKRKFPDKIIFEIGKNVGCRKSFFWLIHEAARKYPNYDYYSFADQDDVWYDDKLSTGIEALEKIGNQYKVYFCSYQMVDENLNIIPTKQMRVKGSYEEAFVFQPCLGCSMILSHNLIEKASLADPKECNIHDVWCYMLNLALGGEVIQDPSIHLLYRQHSNNVIGSNQSFKNRWKRRFHSFRKNDKLRQRLAKELLRIYSNELPEDKRKITHMICEYETSMIDKIKIICSSHFRTIKQTHNIMFIIAVLTNRI